MSSRVIPNYEIQEDFEKLFEFRSKERARINGVALKFKRAVGATIRKFQLSESATSIPSQKPYFGYTRGSARGKYD